jgi:hypothetical protein
MPVAACAMGPLDRQLTVAQSSVHCVHDVISSQFPSSVVARLVDDAGTVILDAGMHPSRKAGSAGVAGGACLPDLPVVFDG